jgi:hypothetical protein
MDGLLDGASSNPAAMAKRAVAQNSAAVPNTLRTPKKALSKRYPDTPAGVRPQWHAGGAHGAVPTKCAQVTGSDVAIPAKFG